MKGDFGDDVLGGSSHDLFQWLIGPWIINRLMIRLWDPLKMAMKIAYGDPNYLQVLG